MHRKMYKTSITQIRKKIERKKTNTQKVRNGIL
jgi:hypothetical protein